jgi:hypothetical protein
MAFDLRASSAPVAMIQIATRAALRTTKIRRLPIDRVLAATLLACGILWIGASDAAAQQPSSFLASRQNRDEAIRAIPFNQLDERVRAGLTPVVSSPSLYRRLPVQAVDCDPDLFQFLVRYPEVIVDIWRLMEVTKVQVTRTGPTTFETSDGSGTVASVELVYGTPHMHVFYASGFYEGPLLRNRLTGSCVLLLRSAYATQSGRYQITNTLDVFAKMDNAGVELLAKTLHPVVGKTADYNFIETSKFVSQLSQASESNGPGIQRLAANLTNVEPVVRQAFAQHADVVYQRGLLRQNSPLDPLTAAGSMHGNAAFRLAPATGPGTQLMPVTPRQHTPAYRR